MTNWKKQPVTYGNVFTVLKVVAVLLLLLWGYNVAHNVYEEKLEEARHQGQWEGRCAVLLAIGDLYDEAPKRCAEIRG